MQNREHLLEAAFAMVNRRRDPSEPIRANDPVALDPAFLNIKSVLSADVVAQYTGENAYAMRMPGAQSYADLAADLERLRREWGLI